jgi:hypothetical protein
LALESFLDAKATGWDPCPPSCFNTAPIPMLEPNSDDRIPTGAEVVVPTVSTEELRK